MTGELWRADAACYGLDWFTDDKERKAAVEVCADCPVRQECLDYAVRTARSSHRNYLIVHGGLTPDQLSEHIRRVRRRERRLRVRAVAA